MKNENPETAPHGVGCLPSGSPTLSTRAGASFCADDLTGPEREEGVTERIVAIEYYGGKPFAVQTEVTADYSRKPWFNPATDRAICHSANWYDIEWSRTNKQHYWHNSGGGGDPMEFHVNGSYVKPIPPPCKLWLADGVKCVEGYSKGRKLRTVSAAKMLAKGYQIIAWPLELTRFLDEWKREEGRRTWNPFEVSDGDTECEYCKYCKDRLTTNDENWICDHVHWCDECSWWVYETKAGCVRLDDSEGKPVKHDDENEE